MSMVEKEYMKTVSFTIFLGINLTNDVNDLYKENYKPLKKLKKITEDEKISQAHGLVEST
jgi:hypothetical protein